MYFLWKCLGNNISLINMGLSKGATITWNSKAIIRIYFDSMFGDNEGTM